MENTGRYQKGHKESPQIREKRIKALSEAWKDRADYHGMYGTKFHNSWRSMVTRCNGTAGLDSIKKYKNKGITVCERWLKFKNFYEDMFPSYIEGLTIDRIKNEFGYFKENCRWATQKQQQNNRTNSLRIEYMGDSLTAREWSDKLGLSFHIIRNRYYRFFVKGKIKIEEVFLLK